MPITTDYILGIEMKQFISHSYALAVSCPSSAHDQLTKSQQPDHLGGWFWWKIDGLIKN